MGSTITNGAKCTCEIKSRISVAKAAFKKGKKKILSTSKLGLNLRKELTKCYICSVALYDVETWTLRKLEITGKF
jgi:hypothetical protein